MRPVKRSGLGFQRGVWATSWLALATVVGTASEPDRVAAAKATVEKAAAEEKAAHTEWNSREMARSATREILVSARNTVERALQNVLAAQESCRQKLAAARVAREAAAENDPNRKPALEQAAARAAAEVAAAEKQVAQRLATARAAADRMFTDQRVAHQAVKDLRVVEQTLAEKMHSTRAAERTVLALEAEAAQIAAEKALAEKGEVASAEKAAAAQAAAEKAQAADRAVREGDVLAAWEAQAWLGVQQSTLQQLAAGNGSAAEIATRLAAVEPDTARKKALEEFAAKATAQKVAAEKAAAEKAQARRAADWNLYLLRIAAVGGLAPLAPECWDYAKARHLLVRAGFGGTSQEVAKLHQMGFYRAVECLVAFQRQPAANVPFDAGPPARPDPLEAKLRNDFVRSQVTAARRAAEGAQIGKLRHWWLKRMVESPRPLQEKLTLFWHGHFATQYSVVQNSYTMYHQNQLFREHAAGNFGGLLQGLVHDPVMLRYLDNNTNVKGHANENLAREIMELFSMGAYQGYNEADVREAARALTGYNFDPRTGLFHLAAAQHDEGPKTIFGRTGNWTGDDVVDLILEQPSTSRFIARKLFEYFAYEDPSPETVERLARVLRAYQYELAPMLQNLFLSEEFYSERALGTQIKSPVQLVVGTLRDLGVTQTTDPGMLDRVVRSMGQELFEPPDVKGWRYGRSWVNTNRIFIRYNATAELIRTVSQPGQRGIDVVALLKGCGCQSPTQVVDFLAKACFSRPLSERKRQDLIAYLKDLPPASDWATQRPAVNEKLQDLLVLMTSMPEFQMY